MDIFIIGSGNVATAIGRAILKTEHTIAGIYSRNLKSGRQLATKLKCNFINEIGQINTACDIYLIAVKDDAIVPLAEKMPVVKGIVVHTSGSIPMLNISLRNGVIYPVETISKSRSVHFRKVPVCIEASDNDSLKSIQILASALSDQVYLLSSAQRASLHLSAVFANNFTNYLYGVACALLEQEKLPKELIHRLIESTASNAVKRNPFTIQTGPARRNDQKVISRHLQMLKDHPEYQATYKLLSDQLISLYRKEFSDKEDS